MTTREELALDSLREAAALLAAPQTGTPAIRVSPANVELALTAIAIEGIECSENHIFRLSCPFCRDVMGEALAGKLLAAPEREALDRETMTKALAKAAPFTLHDRESADALAAILLRSFAGSGIRLAAGKEDRG